MITLVVVIGYLALATVIAGFAARWTADNWGLCTKDHDRFKSLCKSYHGKNCWQATGEVTPSVLALAFGAALLWPVSFVPFAAYLIAVRRPSPVLAAKRIAELERELGIRHY